MVVCECPSAEELQLYISGRLASARHDAIDAHLDACPTCEKTAYALDAGASTPLSFLVSPSAVAPDTDEPALRRLVALVKGLQGQAPPEKGEVLGGYTLLEPIGAGGMGRVFKAYHQRMKRVVALKLLAPDLLRSEAAVRRFQREVEAAARLTHPNIVAAYDAGEANGRHFLVMEHVEGRNLAEVVKQEGPLSVERAMQCLLQAARGLEHAHAAGIVHRDVKPSNLLLHQPRPGLPGAGLVKLLDLGLVRLSLSSEAPPEADLTTTGAVMGTAPFMAPEQAADTRSADQRADIYSLGCTLHFLLTGKPPYTGKTAMEVLFAHREQPIPSLREARPDCPPALDDLFRSMLAKRVEDRPASLTGVIATLERLSQTPPRRVPSRKGRWLAAAALALAAGVLLAFALPSLLSVAPPPGTTSPAVAVTAARPKGPVVEMVRVAAGEFQMGSPRADMLALDDEKPQHRVQILRPFQLGKTKVTQAQFREVMGSNPSAFSGTGKYRAAVAGLDTSPHPVESLTWLDAVRFCNALSQREGLPAYYRIDGESVRILGGTGYRLPTEAEWEYACRAGTDTRWYFGDDPAALTDHAWFADNAGRTTHPVGRKKPNAWGLYDILGNVPEWCWDRYTADYYKRSPDSDPAGSGDGVTRVYRGGAWNTSAEQTRPAARGSLGAMYGVLTPVGLRVARSVGP